MVYLYSTMMHGPINLRLKSKLCARGATTMNLCAKCDYEIWPPSNVNHTAFLTGLNYKDTLR